MKYLMALLFLFTILADDPCGYEWSDGDLPDREWNCPDEGTWYIDEACKVKKEAAFQAAIVAAKVEQCECETYILGSPILTPTQVTIGLSACQSTFEEAHADAHDTFMAADCCVEVEAFAPPFGGAFAVR